MTSGTNSTWRTRTRLMPHQREAVAKLLPTRVGALFMEMGTGKTRTVIELARLRWDKVDRVFWICPVSLKETVRFEILKHTTVTPGEIYTFDQRTTQQAVPAEARWIIVGLESVSGSCRVALALAGLITERSFVVVDESSYIKGHRSLRAGRLTRYSEHCRYRMILTGTPISQGIQDLFAQMRFLSPRILGYKSWYSFARNHLEYSEKFKGLIVRTHNTAFIAAKIRPYVYQVTKQECLTLPSKLYDSRLCDLTPEQHRYYAEAKEHYLTEALEEDDWSSISIFKMFTALQSIVCGFWKTPKGEHITFPTYRLETLLQALYEIPPEEKVVVWAKYHHCVEAIASALQAHFGKDQARVFYGKLAERDRNCELETWRARGRFLVATQSSGGHGLTLNESCCSVFYANSFKYSERLQAEDRNHRIGQERPVTYLDIRSTSGIDRRIAQALDRKSDAVRDFKREVDKVKKSRNERLRKLVEAL